MNIKYIIILSFVFVLAPIMSFAATLTLSPSSSTINIGSNFTVNVLLDTQGSAINGVDAYINYPSSLSVVDDDGGTSGAQITAGTLMAVLQDNIVDTVNRKINFSQVATAGTTYSGSGTLATIHFTALSVGTASVTFNFTSGATNDSNVISGTNKGVDLLTSVTNGSYTLQGFNFSLSATNPASVVQGNSTSSTVTATLSSGSTTAVSFSASGFPSGITASFSPTSCSPTCNSTLNITTSGSTPAGTTTITITAIGGGVTKTTTVPLTITAAPLSNISFAVSLEGDSNQNDNSFDIRIYNAGTTTVAQEFLARTPVSGSITIPTTSIAAGTYDIKVRSVMFLTRKHTNIALASNSSFTITKLLAGNLNSDQIINSLDWSIMSPVWNTNNATADINKDGIVNTADFSFISQNLMQIQDWNN